MRLTHQYATQGANIAAFTLLLLGMGISCFGQDGLRSDKLVNQEIRMQGKVLLTKDSIFRNQAVPLKKSINSQFSETKPAVAPNGTRLYFSRAFHPNNTAGSIDQEDIWYTEYDEDQDAWSESIRLPGDLNVEGPTSINSISASGDTMIYASIYKIKKKIYPDLAYSVNHNGKWSEPISIDIKNHYNLSERTDAYVSLNRGVIISAVERMETAGSRDLYISFWDGVSATEPMNMGAIINTPLEESSPYLASDTKTLYFASKGHSGFGGYDIFTTTRLDDSWLNWSQPQNLGQSVNGPKDEEYFIITHCKRFAFFSKEVSEHNTDIFRLNLVELTKAKFR